MAEEKKNKYWHAVAVCMMCMFFLYSLQFIFIVSTDAAFSSITITDVEPTELHPGDTKEVTVMVKNNGGRDARDIRLEFQGTKIVSLVGPTVVHINTLNSWCTKEVKIRVHVEDEAPNGVYPIPVACSWKGYYFDPTKGYVSTAPIEATLGISFNIMGKITINIGDVSTDPTDIRPGDEDVEIRAFIENSGEAAAKDVEAKLLCNNKFKPSWSGTDRSYIGRLNSGDLKEAIFHVDIADGIESKMYSIPLKIKYKDTRERAYEVMRSVDILVEPKPDFKIFSFSTQPKNISAGDHVILQLRIRNIGSEEGESISVRSMGEAEVPFDFDVKSDYVGNLKVGEEGVAILEFDVDKEDIAQKEYQQGIEIRCTGDRDLGDENVYLFDRMVPISVSSSNSGGFSVPGFEALLSFFALFVVFIFLRRRR